jgi:hypothetical protein
VAKSVLTVNVLFQVELGEVLPVAFPAVATTVIALPLTPGAGAEATELPVVPVEPVTSHFNKFAPKLR